MPVGPGTGPGPNPSAPQLGGLYSPLISGAGYGGAVPTTEQVWGTHALAVHASQNRSFLTPAAYGPNNAFPGDQYEWGNSQRQLYEQGATRSIFRSVVATAVVTAAVSAFVTDANITQPYVDSPTSFIARSVAAGQTPPIIPQIGAAPLQQDFTLQAQLFKPMVGPQGPTVRQFTSGPLQIDLTQQGVVFSPLPNREGPVPPLTWGAPLQQDFTLQAQLSKPLITGQGPVPPATWGSPQADPTQIQPQVFKSQPAPAIVANPVSPFFVVPPQTEERPTRVVFTAQLAGQTPPVILALTVPPQTDPTQIQGQLFKPLIIGQGPVPAPTSGAPQADPTQVPAQLFKALPAPPIIPNPIAAFFSIPPQFEERPTRALFPSVVAGQTPPVISQLYAAPLQQDLTIQPLIIPPSLYVSYAMKTITAGPQLLDLTQQAVFVKPSPGYQGQVPLPLLTAAPQQIDLTLQARVFGASQAAVTVTGPTVAMLPAVPPQFDPSANQTRLFTQSTFSPSLVITAMYRVGGPRTGDTNTNYRDQTRIPNQFTSRDLH